MDQGERKGERERERENKLKGFCSLEEISVARSEIRQKFIMPISKIIGKF
jgi:hypothetical protein